MQSWSLPKSIVSIVQSKVDPKMTTVACVSKAPISNSLGLMNSGSGGGGAITCSEDTTGSPTKVANACDAKAITVKTINLFTRVAAFSCRLLSYGSSAFWHPISSTGSIKGIPGRPKKRRIHLLMPNLLNRIRRLTLFAVFCVAGFNAAVGRSAETLSASKKQSWCSMVIGRPSRL
jgi:hypothetical protein